MVFFDLNTEPVEYYLRCRYSCCWAELCKASAVWG